MAAKNPSRKLMVLAVVLAVAAIAAAGMAVVSAGEVQAGATSPFTVLLWAAAAALSGLIGVIAALVAMVRARKPDPAVR